MARRLHRIKYPPKADKDKTKVTILKPIPRLRFFHSREAVEEAYEVLRAFSILPGKGGWYDQHPRWLHDLRKIMHFYDDVPENLSGWLSGSAGGKRLTGRRAADE